MSDIDGSDANVVDLSASTDAMVRLPGAEKPVPVANVMTRDQHLAASSKRAQELEAQYAPYKQIEALLSSDEGVEQLLGALVEQGYGSSWLTSGSAPTGGSENVASAGQKLSGGDEDRIPSWATRMQEELANAQKQNAVLMQTIATMNANSAVEKEVEQVRKINPDVDLGKLAETTARLRNGATLVDALKYATVDDREKEIADLKEQVRRLTLAQQVPGYDQLFEGAPSSRPKSLTPDNKEDAIRDILKRAGQSLQP